MLRDFHSMTTQQGAVKICSLDPACLTVIARPASRCEQRACSAHPARETCFMRLLSTPVALNCMRILLCARYAVLLGAPVCAGTHVDVIVWVPEAIHDHSIFKLWRQHDINQLPSDIIRHVTSPISVTFEIGLHARRCFACPG